MKMFFTATLLAFTLHTSLTYSALATSHEKLLLEEQILHQYQGHGKTRRILKEILKETCLRPENKLKIYSKIFQRAKTQNIPVTIIIDILIDCAAINTIFDLKIFSTHLSILLTPEQKIKYTNRLTRLDYLESNLREAVEENDIVTAKYFLKKGARINGHDHVGYNALMAAVFRGAEEAATLLAQQPEADRDAQTDHGDTALDLAKQGHYDKIELMLLKDPKELQKASSCILS